LRTRRLPLRYHLLPHRRSLPKSRPSPRLRPARRSPWATAPAHRGVSCARWNASPAGDQRSRLPHRPPHPPPHPAPVADPVLPARPTPLLNFESVSVPDKQIKAFRRVLRDLWEETLEKKKPREWNAALLRVTEGRKSRYDPKTKERTFFYSWCGDWVTYHLERAGCLHTCLNRATLHGKWHPGKNLSLLRVWAGDKQAASWSPKYVKDLFKNDPSAGDAWHPWDDKKDACKDGYEPQLGDLVLTPRKNGDHIEFWVSVSRLAPSTPY
jgi:hypothetical protein